MTHEEIKAAWNRQADQFNQWEALGEDEKINFTIREVEKALATPGREIFTEMVKVFAELHKVYADGVKSHNPVDLAAVRELEVTSKVIEEVKANFGIGAGASQNSH